MVNGKNILLGITGGIAAYKSADLVRRLAAKGAHVHVVMTRHAGEFITPLTFQTLSRNRVISDLFDPFPGGEVAHIVLAEKADVFLIAPATANVIAKLAHGIADDMLTTTALAVQSPILVAPAMNTRMWENPVVQDNVSRLQKKGVHLIAPESGSLACGYEGKGRMAEIDVILDEVFDVLTPKDLAQETVLVTAGPTREFFDPVRCITNRSSGKMGYAMARVARRRGAQVILVSGPTELPPVRNVRLFSVESAREMRKVVMDNFKKASIIIKAAAVSDYRPGRTVREKMKKSKAALSVELEKNPDILYELGRIKRQRCLIGFAAETSNVISSAKAKLDRKNLDLIVANDVKQPGIGFGADYNEVKLIDRGGKVEALPRMEKEELASRILDRAIEIKKGLRSQGSTKGSSPGGR
jgi:phosphopantothenoylcysteine decarboxylase/phosphopantothenate--cysteine ligase